MKHRSATPIATLTATAFLAASALLGAVIFAGRPFRTAVPLAFVLLVVVGAVRFGALVGILGSLLGAAIFAHFLFPPLGSMRVEGDVARANLGWMLMAGISLSYLFARTDVPDRHKHHHK